jgi:predicted nucleic acid-binding protein
MRICIDSNQFVFGISGSNVASETVLKLLPRLEVIIPRLIMKEVTRNLSQSQVKSFYALLNQSPHVSIIEDNVPAELVRKYVGLGLREKADAVIGAFAEWQNVRYIISDNRHFLDELQSNAFEVISPEEFLRLYYWAVMQENQ